MTDYSPAQIGLGGDRFETPGVSAGRSPVRRSSPAAAPSTIHRQNDRVDVSDRARAIASGQPRVELVKRIRAQIQAGTYDTPERLDAALDAMIRQAESGR